MRGKQPAKCPALILVALRALAFDSPLHNRLEDSLRATRLCTTAAAVLPRDRVK